MRIGYSQLCDWWSVGVILYEMLVGQPPFLAPTPAETQYKVIHWERTLRVPRVGANGEKVGGVAKDLILKLCTDHGRRLGKNGAREVKVRLLRFFGSSVWRMTGWRRFFCQCGKKCEMVNGEIMFFFTTKYVFRQMVVFLCQHYFRQKHFRQTDFLLLFQRNSIAMVTNYCIKTGPPLLHDPHDPPINPLPRHLPNLHPTNHGAVHPENHPPHGHVKLRPL